MKSILLTASALFFSASVFAQNSISKIWETEPVFLTPESVLFDRQSDILYVANIGHFDTPRSGYISKLKTDGTIIEKEWVPQLTAAKGMGLVNQHLYVAELTSVAVIDVNQGKIEKRIHIEDTEFLNDITVNKDGIVYVSESRRGKVFRIKNEETTLYIDQLPNVNGLLAVGEDLYILSDGKLLKADSKRRLTVIAEGIEGGADGIEQVKDGEFIVTGWAGMMYYIKSDGSKQVLLDSREQKINAADLGYDAQKKIIYLPTFSKNKIVAYQLK